MGQRTLVLLTAIVTSLAALAATPTLPQTYLDTTYVAPTGDTHAVAAGGDVQAAINAASPGDVITLAAGATFTGNYTLPVKAGAGWITIRTSTPDTDLPLGTRVTPAASAKLAKLQTTANLSVFTTSGAAHHYRLVGLEITAAASLPTQYGLVSLGLGTETSAANLPNNIILDRCYIHGNATTQLQNGVRLNCASAAIIDSYIDECHATSFESHCIGGFNGPGPFKIVNNFLGGSTINLLFGGAKPAITNLVPSDIEFRRNYCYRPLTWRPGDPSYAGTEWYVKNLFELKNAQRVLIDGNIFEQNWPHNPLTAPDGSQQAGYAMLFTVRAESGTAPWATVSDITVTKNIIRKSNCGISFYGTEGAGGQRIKIENNLFDDIGLNWGNNDRSGMFAQLDNFDDTTINHNTIINDGDILFANSVSGGTFTFTNNIVNHGCARTTNPNYGINGVGTGPGTPTFNTYLSTYNCLKNAMRGGAAYTASYPAGHYFPGAWSNVGFTDLAGRNYKLTAASPYYQQGTDGKDLGCDFDALNAAQTATNAAPVLASLSATPNPAVPNQAVQFVAVASDAENDPLTYAWEFGDGTSGSGSTAVHVYAAAGTYTAKVTVSESSGGTASASVQVTVNDSGGGALPDSDGDGVSDQQEILDGTDPLDPNSFKRLPLTMLKVSGSVKFSSAGGDSCSVSGIIPGMPAGFKPAGVVAVLDIGGAKVTFTLDAKARAKSGSSSISLRIKGVRNKTTKQIDFLGGDVPFKAKIMRGSWAADWANEGVDPAATKASTPMDVQVNLDLGTAHYGALVTTTYSSKAGKGGKFFKK